MELISNLSQPEHIQQIHDLVSKYQEQPQLIDAYLSDIVGWKSDNGGVVGINQDRARVGNLNPPFSPPEASQQLSDEAGEINAPIKNGNRRFVGLTEIFIAELDLRTEQMQKKQQEHSMEDISDENENANRVDTLTTLTSSSRIVLSLKTMYLFTQIRGFSILKYFPNPFSLFPRLFSLLKEIQSLHLWESECMLWLWLSHLSRNPFPIESLTQDPHMYIDELYRTAVESFYTSSNVKMCAAEFMGRLLNRRDVITSGFLSKFVNLAKDTLLHMDSSLDSDPLTIFFRISVLKTLTLIMKYTPDRLIVLPFIMELFDFVTINTEKESTLMKHMHMKFTQRIGLLLLKPIVVSWRYQKSRQSLLANLSKGKAVSAGDHAADAHESNEDEGIDVPEEIEVILDKLISGLRDSDTVVRWSAAKGVGRITMRLPSDMGDDVVSFVLELLSHDEQDGAWHGGCLALAELARRGLLLPSRLDDVIPLIMKALHYDIRKGSHSVGAHVRDSACYVCWAFARAYAPSVFEPYVSTLASGLLKTALFDREVNCRRAASAAFQENVGRQGNFPHGIDILTKADYFTLSNISNAYLSISDFVAQFEEYTLDLVNHLIDTKIVHWDKSLRSLAARTVGILSHHNPDFVVKELLKKLAPMALSEELGKRHGAVLTISEIILNVDYKLIESELLSEILHLVPNIDAKRLYRGKGGEVMREAVCRFIECVSLREIPLPAQIAVSTGLGRSQMKGTRSVYQKAINDNLKHPNEDIVEQALLSLKSFSVTYYNTEEWIPRVQDLIIAPMLKELETDNPATRRGYLLALGSFPKMLLLNKFEQYAKVLLDQIPLERRVTDRDAESRRNAVRGVINLCETVGAEDISEEMIETIFEALFVGVQDYATDNRGDVGLWVREASMDAMKRFTLLLARAKKLKSEYAVRVFQALLKQANEKIDRARDIAGRAVEKLVSDAAMISGNYIPHYDEIRRIIINGRPQKYLKPKVELLHHNDKDEDEENMDTSQPDADADADEKPVNEDQVDCVDRVDRADDAEEGASEEEMYTPILLNNRFQNQIRSESSQYGIDWINPEITFPILVNILPFPEYQFSILSGLVISVGGLTKYIAYSSCDSLTKFMKNNPQYTPQIANSLLEVLRHYTQDKRVLVPAFKMLTLVLSHECFNDLQPGKSTFIEDLLELLQDELRGSKDIQKLLTAVPLVMQLIPFEEPARKKAFRLAFGLLINRFPKVRMFTADQLVSTTQTYAEDVMDESILDDVLEILIETNWGESFEEERDSVNKLRTMFGIEIPQKKVEID